MSDAVRALLAEFLDVAERDDELRARLRALVLDVPDTRPLADDGRRFLSVADVVERSGLSEKTVRRAIAAGELRSSKPGGRRIVAVADFETWARAGRDGRPRPPAGAKRSARPAAGTSFAATLRSRVR